MKKLDEWFEALSTRVDRFTATSRAFAGACLVVLVWAVTGPVFHFSDTWQLVINTGTTIVTFLMVFLLQNSQNRSAQRDREAADRDAEINRRTYNVLRIVEEHVEEAKKLNARNLRMLVRLEGQQERELEILQQDDASKRLSTEIDDLLKRE